MTWWFEGCTRRRRRVGVGVGMGLGVGVGAQAFNPIRAAHVRLVIVIAHDHEQRANCRV